MMIKKTIFICCEQVEKAKKVLSDFVHKEYFVAQTANTDHDLVNKAGGSNVWVQWTQCDHASIAGILSAADADASHFVGLLQIDEIPKVASAIKGMVSAKRLIPVYLAYRDTTNSAERTAENEQLSRVLKLLLAK